MVDILHRVGVEASASRVYRAVAAREGLAGWWTEHVSGDENLGGTLSFLFADGGPSMKVLELLPDRRVAWECLSGPPEWVGTRLSFDLKEDAGETVLLFAQRGWREPVEFMHACSTKWAVFLMSLKACVETGRGTPYPRDTRVSRWF
jgi:uncharacterized protein YndB with AHSA1/START domain